MLAGSMLVVVVNTPLALWIVTCAPVTGMAS
jgi:hypothetical protein